MLKTGARPALMNLVLRITIIRRSGYCVTSQVDADTADRLDVSLRSYISDKAGRGAIPFCFLNEHCPLPFPTYSHFA